jgi:RNA polymerase sigma-70 factor (ECF subfamily)
VDEQGFQQQIDPDILQLTRVKSRQLVGSYGFDRCDAEDLQQELLLDFLTRSRSFDARRCSPRTFATRVVNNRIATILEARKAKCRDYHAPRVYLSSQFDPSSPELVSSLATLGWQGGGSLPEDRMNLQLDVEQILTRLPAALVSLCRLLIACDSAVEAAAMAGMSRATLYRNIGRLRGVLAGAGLHPNNSRTRSPSVSGDGRDEHR